MKFMLSSRIRKPINPVYRVLIILLSVIAVAHADRSLAQITGTTAICTGAITTLTDTGTGTWSSSNALVATIGSATGVLSGVATGTVTIVYHPTTGANSSTVVTVNPLPTVYGITGGGHYCAGGAGLHIGLSGSTPGYSYQLFNGTTPTGSALTGTGSSFDFGLVTGAGYYSVTATNPATGCSATMTGYDTITINPAPNPISGPSTLCPLATASLASSPAGGTWTSNVTAVATIGSSSGIVSAASTGIANITYTLPVTGCAATFLVAVTNTVCPIPAVPPVCVSNPATLTDCVTGGIWTSSNPSVATIGSLSGVVSGVVAGTDTITYTLGTTGCTVTATLSVITAPAAITGPASACVGSTITLSDATPSGTWASNSPSNATVSATGVVTGIATGAATISYTSGGCSATRLITVNSAPGAIGGPGNVCVGATITETDTATGGTWSITPTSIATIGSATGVVSGVSPGTAIVTYTSGTCVATRTITVNAAYPISGPTGICVTATTNLVDAAPGGTWLSSNPGIATISGSGLVTGIAPGSTLISYTLPAGCAVTTTVTVGAYPGPITSPATICNGTCANFSAGMSGGTWSSSFPLIATVDASTGNVCGLAPGAVTISYVLSGCSTSTIITVNPAPAAISGSAGICVGQTHTYTDVFSGGLWSSGSPLVATMGSSSGILTGINSGTVIISYTLLNGCSAVLPVVVYPFTPSTGPTAVCIGQQIGLANPTFGGTWSSASPAVATVNSGGIVTGIAAGVATISYTLPGGCVATSLVTVNTLPAVITGPHTLCAGSIIALSETSTGGSWSSNDGTIAIVDPSGVVSGIAPGTDSIRYSYAGGCFTTFAITVNTLPSTIAGPAVVCAGGSVTLSDLPTGGTWLSSLPSVATINTVTGLVGGASAGISTITYTLPTGCYITRPMTVTAAPAPITGALSVCIGSVSALTDVSPGGTWTSNNPSVAPVGSATGIVSGDFPGDAIISYSTGTGCNVSATVTVNPLPGPIIGSTLICQGATTTLTDPSAGGTWTSSNAAIAAIVATSGIVSGVTSGLVTINYTLTTGCVSSINFFVNPLPAPITGVASACVGNITALNDLTPGGSWSSSNSLIAPVGISGIVTGLSIGTATISYTLGTGCGVAYPVSVNAVPVAISGPTSVCQGATIALTDGVAGGTWISSNPAIAAAGSSSGIISGVSSGSVLITYSTGAGCQLTSALTVNPLPLPISGPSAMCSATSVAFTDGTPVGTWSSGNPAIASIGTYTGSVYGVAAGTVTISYTQLCTVTHTLTVNPSPSVITGAINTCAGGVIALHDSVLGGTWVSSAPGIAFAGSLSGVVSGLSAGTATIDYILPGGCYSSAAINIYAAPVPFTVTGGGSYCSGGPGVHIGLSGSESGVNYLLYRGTTPTGTFPGMGSPLDFGLQTITGSYTVVGTGSLSGCSVHMPDTVVVTVTPTVTPSVTFTPSPGDTVCSGTSVLFSAMPTFGGSSPAYQWLVNGVVVAGSSSYSYIPVNGDIVLVKMASSAVCPTADTVTHFVAMTVHPSATPTIAITATPNDTVCRGTLVSMTQSTTYAGTAPAYTWVKNGASAGSGPVFSFLPVNNDQIYCVLHSNYQCRLSTDDTSILVTIKVDTPVTPVVTITASPGHTIAAGMNDTLTATATNGGFSPTWQWYLNGNAIPGATSNTYIIDTMHTPQLDSFTCKVTSSGPCIVSGSALTYISVVPNEVRAVSAQGTISIVPNPNRGAFTITAALPPAPPDEAELVITDMLGQTVYRKQETVRSGALKCSVQLGNNVAAGWYVVTIRSGAGMFAYRMVIE